MLSREAGALLTVNVAVSWEAIMRDSGNVELTRVKDLFILFFFGCCLFLWHYRRPMHLLVMGALIFIKADKFTLVEIWESLSSIHSESTDSVIL